MHPIVGNEVKININMHWNISGSEAMAFIRIERRLIMLITNQGKSSITIKVDMKQVLNSLDKRNLKLMEVFGLFFSSFVLRQKPL